jgi:hypothetical protein
MSESRVYRGRCDGMLFSEIIALLRHEQLLAKVCINLIQSTLGQSLITIPTIVVIFELI